MTPFPFYVYFYGRFGFNMKVLIVAATAFEIRPFLESLPVVRNTGSLL